MLLYNGLVRLRQAHFFIACDMPTIHQPQEPVRDCFDYQEQRIFKPTQAALNEVLSNCKISKKVRAILDNLYSDYFCD